MIVALYVCLVMMGVAAALALVRLQRGPTNLDRVVALDVITAATVGILVVVMALHRRIDLLPLLVVFSSIGFIGTTVVARFSPAESISARRFLSEDEADRLLTPEFDDHDEPLHPDADIRSTNEAGEHR